MSSSNFMSHFRNAFPSFRRVSLSFSPIVQKNWFRTLGVIIGVVAACGFGINAHEAPDTVQAGALAPNFTLPSQEDKPVSLTDYKGTSAAQSCFQEYSRRSLIQEAFRPEGSTLVAISAFTKTVCSSARSSPSKISASRRWMRRFSGFTFERSSSASWM